MTGDELTTWRLDHERRLSGIETAVQTLAEAAKQQEDFNSKVIEFMSSVRTWGVVALMLYALGQAVLVARLA